MLPNVKRLNDVNSLLLLRAEVALKAGSSGLAKLVTEMRAQLMKLTGSDFTGHHLLQLKKQALVSCEGAQQTSTCGFAYLRSLTRRTTSLSSHTVPYMPTCAA